MEVLRGSEGGSMRSSRLNPAAAPYVPAAQRAVEDFSSEWWKLVTTSSGFADYWLRECFHDYEEEEEEQYDDDFSLPDDVDQLFYPTHQEVEDEEKGRESRESWKVAIRGAGKWKAAAAREVDVRRNAATEKAPRLVSVKVSPRTIQQPR